MPLVDLLLHPLAHRQEVGVARRQIADDGGEARPESVGRDAGPGQRLALDELGQFRGNLQTLSINPFDHSTLSLAPSQSGA